MSKHTRYNCSPKGRANHARHNLRSNPRRVRMRAGGIEFYLGQAPTAEDAQRLRRKIKEESPK